MVRRSVLPFLANLAHVTLVSPPCFLGLMSGVIHLSPPRSLSCLTLYFQLLLFTSPRPLPKRIICRSVISRPPMLMSSVFSSCPNCQSIGLIMDYCASLRFFFTSGIFMVDCAPQRTAALLGGQFAVPLLLLFRAQSLLSVNHRTSLLLTTLAYSASRRGPLRTAVAKNPLCSGTLVSYALSNDVLRSRLSPYNLAHTPSSLYLFPRRVLRALGLFFFFFCLPLATWPPLPIF